MLGRTSRVLAISPHADDVELGVGGTLLRLAKEGAEIHTMLCIARDEALLSNGAVSSETRLTEFQTSMALLGSDYSLMPGYSKALADLPKAKVVAAMDACIAGFKPTVVLIPLPSFHQEHQYIHDCAIAACRPTKSQILPTVLSYEYPAANWGPSAGYNPASGGVYVNISDFFKGKLELLKAHKSQGFDRGGLVSFQGVDALARMRGSESGCRHAELLYLLRHTL